VLPVPPLIDRAVVMLAHVAPSEVVVARQQFVQITTRPSLWLLMLSLFGAASLNAGRDGAYG